jgi:hypothetical protein
MTHVLASNNRCKGPDIFPAALKMINGRTEFWGRAKRNCKFKILLEGQTLFFGTRPETSLFLFIM